jgi:AcrR family transcriptional regulator
LTNATSAARKKVTSVPAKGDAEQNAAAKVAKVPTSSRILTAGAELFREHGYAVSTTRQLSARLGITKASLYYHISSKEDLLRLICLESLRRVTESVAAAAEADNDPLETVRAAMYAHLESVLGDLDLHATMLLELRSLTGDFREEVQQARDAYEILFTSVIANAQAAGALRTDLTAKQLTVGVLSMLNWAISWYQPGGGLSPGELAEVFWKLYLDGARRRA